MTGLVTLLSRLAVFFSARKQLLKFAQLFSTLQNAGMPVLRSLRVIQNDLPRGKLKRAVVAVIKDVESGSTLSEAFAKHPQQFNRTFVAMIKAGEAGGALEVMLARLVSYLESPKKSDIGRTIRGLATMISGGVPILEAINIVKEMSATTRVSNMWQAVFNSIREGDTIAAPMSESGLLPCSVLALVDIGEETGDLDTSLYVAADLYDAGVVN